jgi:Mce-associated membrane protein
MTDTAPAQELDTDAPAVSAQAVQAPSTSIRPTATIIAAVVAVLALVAAVVFGFLWHSASSDLDAQRQQETDRQIALNTAKDYTTRSLTYDYNNLDAFFAGVKDGAAQPLQDRYDGVKDALTAIMTESQVVASGEALSAAVDSEVDGVYKISVYAQQQTRNLQTPDGGSVANILAVTVSDHDGRWIVDDYGPKN